MSFFLYGRIIKTLKSSPSRSHSYRARNQVLAISFRLICVLFLLIQFIHSTTELGVKIAQLHYLSSCNSQTTDIRCNVGLYVVVEVIEISNNCLWLVFGVANSFIFIVLIRPFQQPIVAVGSLLHNLACKIKTIFVR